MKHYSTVHADTN